MRIEQGIGDGVDGWQWLARFELNGLKRRLLQTMQDGGEKENPARE